MQNKSVIKIVVQYYYIVYSYEKLDISFLNDTLLRLIVMVVLYISTERKYSFESLKSFGWNHLTNFQKTLSVFHIRNITYSVYIYCINYISNEKQHYITVVPLQETISKQNMIGDINMKSKIISWPLISIYSCNNNRNLKQFYAKNCLP